MAFRQAWLDEREREIRQQFLEELRNYHRVQQVWDLEPLKSSRRKGVLQIWAQFLDIEDNRLRQVFLGSGKWTRAWASALQRVKHVKSFL